MPMLYNDPNDTPSSISGTNKDTTQSTQFNTFLYQKKALGELKKEQYFSQMADTVSMP